MLNVKLVDGPPQEIREFDDEVVNHLTGEDVEVIREIFRTPLTGSYNWDYEDANAKIRKLYELGKRFNWDAQMDVAWDTPFPHTEYPSAPEMNAYLGNPKYEALSPEDKLKFAWRSQAQTLSQFMHGEQGAMLVASQLVFCAPTFDVKFYASSQTFDEARHVEVFHKYLVERCKTIYPINPNLKILLDKVLTDERWDLKFIGMQILIEGLALAAFQSIHMTTRDPLLRQIVELVMRDEGRHVAFGVNYLENWIRALPEHEIEERAQFAYEACVIMRERLFDTEVATEFGFTRDEAREINHNAATGQAFRDFLFERMIPNLKRIGLLTESVRPKFEALGVLKFEDAVHDGMIDWASLEKPLPVGTLAIAAE